MDYRSPTFMKPDARWHYLTKKIFRITSRLRLQVFLDLAYTNKPCTLMSKDNEVLRFEKKAVINQVLITADYNALAL